MLELIDTLWNVNCRFNAFAQFVVAELIDTLWNVNEVSSAVSEVSSRINRYIMECKFFISVEYFVILYELIDTLWNVNLVI